MYTRIYGRLRQPMRDLRRTARFAAYSPTPPTARALAHPHIERVLTKSVKGVRNFNIEVMGSKKNSAKSKFFFREIEIFFRVFDIPSECLLCMQSFAKIGRGGLEL